MEKCYADKHLNISKADFEKPLNPLSAELNCEQFENKEIIKSEDKTTIPKEFNF